MNIDPTGAKPGAKNEAKNASKIAEVTDDNFHRTVAESPVPVLLDCWAAWCAPGRATTPHVEALASAYEGRVRVGKVDADASQELTAKLDVRSLPTFLMFKGG